MNSQTNPPDPLKEMDAALEDLRLMNVPEPPDPAPLLALLSAPISAQIRSEIQPVRARRFYMRPVFGYTLAASVLAIVLGGALLLGRTTPAVADVRKAAEKYKFVTYKMKQTTEDKQNGNGSRVSTVYADLKKPRSRTESRTTTLNDTVESVSVTVQDGELILSLISETVIDGKPDANTPDFLKTILTDGRFPQKTGAITRASGPAMKPMLDSLRELEQHKNVTAVRDKRDGKELLKYRLEVEKTTTTLWVDPATKLPVRVEFEMTDPTPTISRIHFVMSDFQWDPELKGVKSLDDFFSTTPPVGYKITDTTKAKDKK